MPDRLIDIVFATPTLSNPQIVENSTSNTVVSVDVGETFSGTIYFVPVSSNTALTASAIKSAGESVAVTAAGTYQLDHTSSLAPETQYWFNVVAENGTAFSDVMQITLTTPALGEPTSTPLDPVERLIDIILHDYRVDSVSDFQRVTGGTITVSAVTSVPTLGNTSLSPLSISAVTDNGDGSYDLTVSVPDDEPILHNTHTFDLTIDGDVQQIQATVTPKDGYFVTDIAVPSVDEGSVFSGYTGDAPQSGGEIEYTIDSIEAGLDFIYEDDGNGLVRWADDQNTDDVSITQNVVVTARYFSPDGSVGAYATMTYEPDLVAPVITLIGDATIELGYGESYIEFGATANDDQDGDITDDIAITHDIDLNNSGTYTVSYNVQDGARNDAATVTRTVNVVPQRLVVIDSINEARDSATVNFSYSGADITGIDYRIDGGAWQSANSPLTINGLNPETAYTFEIRPYNGSLIGQITSATITTLAGIDSTPDAFAFTPITGQALGTYAVSNTITVSGVDVGLDIPVSVADGEYSVSTDGGSTWGAWTTTATNVRLNYVLRVRHTASSEYSTQTDTTLTLGGIAEVFSSTTLADLIAPVISLVGGNVQHIQGEPWVDPGYSATDNNDGVVQVTPSGTIDVDTLGPQQITYTAIDSAGNVATVFRIVTVIEAQSTGPTVLPTINTNGLTSITLLVDQEFVLPNWTATDDLGEVPVIWDRTTLDTSAPILNERFNATATNALGSTPEVLYVTVVPQGTATGFVDAAEIVRVVAKPATLHIHDGEQIPMTSPVDTDGHIWKQFNLDLLVDGEVLLGTPTVLINDVVLGINETQDGMTLREVQTNGADKVKVRLQGAEPEQLYVVTVRYTTNHTPSNDRSQQFYGARL